MVSVVFRYYVQRVKGSTIGTATAAAAGPGRCEVMLIDR